MEEKKKKTVIKKTPIKVDPNTPVAKSKTSGTDEATLKEFDSMKKLMADMQAELQNLRMSKKEFDTSNQVVVNNVNVDRTGEINYYEDDYMEDPAVFFAYSIWFSCASDIRRGKASYLRDKKPVVFNPHYRYTKNSGGRRGQETVSISRFVTNSRTESEWLRNHSLYGIRFFENIKMAIDQDTLVAEAMVSVSNQLSYYNDMQLVNRAAQEGLEITNPDISKLRQKLTHHIAKQKLRNDANARKAKAKSIGIVEEKKVNQAAASGDTATDVY